MTTSDQLSKLRQNFHFDTEAAINKHINLKLTLCYLYRSMVSFYDRDDVALNGFKKFFSYLGDETRNEAEKLMDYLNMRGGRFVLEDIKKPDKGDWASGLNGLNVALDLEKEVNLSLLNLHTLARSYEDSHCTYLVEKKFLDAQISKIKTLADYVAKLKRAGADGLGEYIFDKDLSDKY